MYNKKLLESKIREDVEIGVQLLIDGKSDEWMLENLIGCEEDDFLYNTTGKYPVSRQSAIHISVNSNIKIIVGYLYVQALKITDE